MAGRSIRKRTKLKTPRRGRDPFYGEIRKEIERGPTPTKRGAMPRCDPRSIGVAAGDGGFSWGFAAVASAAIEPSPPLQGPAAHNPTSGADPKCLKTATRITRPAIPSA